MRPERCNCQLRNPDREFLLAMSPAHPLPLPRLLTLVALWVLLVSGHFVFCGWLAWQLPGPPELPDWLQEWEALIGDFGFGISTALEFLWLLGWWAIVGISFWGVVEVIRFCDRLWLQMAGGSPPTKSARGMQQTAAIMWPVLTISLLNLILLPVGAVRQPHSPTGMETAAQLSWHEWSNYLTRSLPVMAGFGLFFATLLILASRIPPRVQGCLAMLIFVGLIVIGLAVMGGWIWLTNGLFEWLPATFGFLGATTLFFTGVTGLVCLPAHFLSKNRRSV